MGRICWCPIYIVVKGQKKADFQRYSLIWSLLDRGLNCQAQCQKKNHLGQLTAVKTHTSLLCILCVPSQSNCTGNIEFLSNSYDPLILAMLSCIFISPSLSAKGKFWSGIFPIMISPLLIYPESLCLHIQCIIMKFTQSNFHSFFKVISLFFIVFLWACYFSHELALFTMS